MINEAEGGRQKMMNNERFKYFQLYKFRNE